MQYNNIAGKKYWNSRSRYLVSSRPAKTRGEIIDVFWSTGIPYKPIPNHILNHYPVTANTATYSYKDRHYAKQEPSCMHPSTKRTFQRKRTSSSYLLIAKHHQKIIHQPSGTYNSRNPNYQRQKPSLTHVEPNQTWTRQQRAVKLFLTQRKEQFCEETVQNLNSRDIDQFWNHQKRASPPLKVNDQLI